ncbi:hypothetical protein MWH25_01545 [Natroniella acetigena]|uniref:hypothetical protein n=1 Tax=Natroniella acetigena TaxID=52004 RepID=UPI00200A182F|nr:hypothetical protein [Natroniella acetigena]MCK8826432.1 hypothetical protein [Natroniella acetigena]
MSDSLKGVIKQNIRANFEQIEEHKLDFISEFIKNNGQYQKIDNYIVFRLFNAVSEREEVFIGNVLFNDYISKLLLRVYRENEKYSGQIELIYNDLENFYYIVKQENIDEFSLEELEDDFKDYFAQNLEELFFTDEDLEDGVYGEFKNLLQHKGYNFISLPFTLIPNFFEEKFKINMINKVMNEFSFEDGLKFCTQYFNVSTRNYEHQMLQSFLSKLLINNVINDLTLYKEICEFDYSNEFKIDLIIQRMKYNSRSKGKKVINGYLEDKIKVSELKNKLNNLNEDIIEFIIKVKNENNFFELIEYIFDISYDEKLIKKLKHLKGDFLDLNINKLNKTPRNEFENYIKYLFESERYGLELLLFFERFIDALGKNDRKIEEVLKIESKIKNCWNIIENNSSVKYLLDMFIIPKDDFKDFLKYFFAKDKLYKVVFIDYLKIKKSISNSVKNKFYDLMRTSKIANKKELIIKISRKEYAKNILPSLINRGMKNIESNDTKCFICFKNNVKVIARNVTTGYGSFKFVNQEEKVENHKRICVSCSIYLWLKLKFLGSYYDNNVFPEKRNLVFFYGQIPDKRINQIQGILNSLYYCTQNPSVYTYEMIDESIEEIEKDYLEEENSEVGNLLQELIESDGESDNERPAKVPPTIWSWYKNGQQSNKVNTHIFSVGQGENMLYTFVLPYALDRSDEIQKKFSQSRVAVYSMLSFLSRLSGVRGSFYYLSTPKLTDEFGGKNRFYYKDKVKEDSLREYELLTEVAWKLINPQSVSGRTYMDRQRNAFKKRLRLANELERLPLICISRIYRELLKDKNSSKYNNLSSIWNKKVNAPNLFPLIKVSNKIRKEVKFMGQKIDTKELKSFTEDLFSELVLISGVFPKSFSKSPTEFEKYPRLLIKKILKYDTEEGKDVLAGFREWSTKLLHSAKGLYDKDKKKMAERIEKIRQSVIEHQEILSRKSNLLYLKRSLFGWIVEFLYPLYDLVEEINSIVDECSEEEINKAKEKAEIKKIKEKFNGMGYNFDNIFLLAKELLISNQNYYKADNNEEDE